MQLNSVNRGGFMSLKKGRTSSYRGWKILLLCREGIDWAVSLLCLVPTGRWLSSAHTDAAVGLPCTSDFLALDIFCNYTHSPQVSIPFKVSTTIPIQPFKVSRAIVRSGGSCVKSPLSATCTMPGEASSSMKSLQFTVKRGWKRVSGGNCVAEHCRLNWEFLLWRPVVKKKQQSIILLPLHKRSGQAESWCQPQPDEISKN